MFSSRKVFGSRILEMSASSIGKLCSQSSLCRSVISRSQEISKLTTQSQITENNTIHSMIEIGEEKTDLQSVLDELSEIVSRGTQLVGVARLVRVMDNIGSKLQAQHSRILTTADN